MDVNVVIDEEKYKTIIKVCNFIIDMSFINKIDLEKHDLLTNLFDIIEQYENKNHFFYD